MVSVDGLIRDLRSASLGYWRPALYSDLAEGITALQSRVIELEELLRPTDENVERCAKAGFFAGQEVDEMMWEHMQPHLSERAREQARAILTTLSNTANSGGIAG